MSNGGYCLGKRNFFPAEWTREKVVNKIYEACENFNKSGEEPAYKNDMLVISGFTDEGIKIKMYITKEGMIMSAYPVPR